MVIRMYMGNKAKARKEITKNKKTKDYNDLKALIAQRNDEMRAYFSGNADDSINYIGNYKKNQLISIKQICFDPFNREEKWEIKEKELLFTLTIGRGIEESGVEMVHINSIEVKYKGIYAYLGGNVYDEIGISGGQNQTVRFFRLLADYTDNIPNKEVKK